MGAGEHEQVQGRHHRKALLRGALQPELRVLEGYRDVQLHAGGCRSTFCVLLFRLSYSQHSGTQLNEFGHSMKRSETNEESYRMKWGSRQPRGVRYRGRPSEGFDRMLQFAFVISTLETPHPKRGTNTK